MSNSTTAGLVELIRDDSHAAAFQGIGQYRTALLQAAAGDGPEVESIYAAQASEIIRLSGLQPALPPRPPEGNGLPRYGLRWNGPEQPLSVPMGDGYWTPWHLAHAQIAGLDGARNAVLDKARLRSVVTDALIGMIAAVTDLVPPKEEPIPDFIQAAIDRAVDRIADALSQGGDIHD